MDYSTDKFFIYDSVNFRSNVWVYNSKDSIGNLWALSYYPFLPIKRPEYQQHLRLNCLSLWFILMLEI